MQQVADTVSIIGRGRLLAEGRVEAILDASGGGAVYRWPTAQEEKSAQEASKAVADAAAAEEKLAAKVDAEIAKRAAADPVVPPKPEG